ncbi:MAG: hypothetical protein M1821_002590 [Bathelium mastoideum]|nr:MAG: hypothetical protein M1821_002590 [Bathelium mastoideum]KAI9685547.1 MAG: hypothetical protein M1822_004405 [Bathelium mastoideum]
MALRAQSRSPDLELSSFGAAPGLSFSDLIQDFHSPLPIGQDGDFPDILQVHPPQPEKERSPESGRISHKHTEININPQGRKVNGQTFDSMTDSTEDIGSRGEFSILDSEETLPTPRVTPALGNPTPSTFSHNALASTTYQPFWTTPADSEHQPHPCYHLACSTLVALCLEDKFSCAKKRTFDASKRHDTPPLTWDQVLRANKTATTTLQQIIDCPCSTGNSHLIFLYSSVISRIIFWYQVANRIIRSVPSQLPNTSSALTSSASTTRSTSLSSLQTHSTPGSAASLSIAIGAFDVDAEDSAALAQHLLLSELRKTARLVERLQTKHVVDMEHEGLMGGLDASGQSSGSLHGVLGKLLKDELSKTIREVKS